MTRMLVASSPLTKMMKTLVGGRPGPWAFISAYKSSRKNPAENIAAQVSLKKDLVEMGLEPVATEGGYKGDPEPSFFVYGLDEMGTIELGNKYEQESVLVGIGGHYRLVQTSDIKDEQTGQVSLAPSEMLGGDARRDIHVLSPGENRFIDEQITTPIPERAKEWPIPGFSEIEKTKKWRRKGIPGKERSRITLQDPSALPPSVASWIARNCRFG